jgi:hypothetical protein
MQERRSGPNEDPLKDVEPERDLSFVEEDQDTEENASLATERMEDAFEEEDDEDEEEETLDEEEEETELPQPVLRLVTSSVSSSAYTQGSHQQMHTVQSFSSGIQHQIYQHQIMTPSTSTSSSQQQQHHIQFNPQQRNYSIVLTRPPSSTGSLTSVQSPIGVRFPSATSTIRLANVSINSAGQLQMIRHIVGSDGGNQTLTRRITIPPELANKIIVRPIGSSGGANSSAGVAHIQKLPDGSNILQYSTGGPVITSVGTLGGGSDGSGNNSFQIQVAASTSGSVSTSSVGGIRVSSPTESRLQQQVTKLNLGSIMNPSFSGGNGSGGNIVRPTTLATSSGQILGTIGSIVRANDIGSPGPVKKLKVCATSRVVLSKLTMQYAS